MNLKSKIQNPKSRRASGVTIIEVLFAILITSVGLLGAIALFPVASSQARKARTNDAVAAAGREAFHMFDAMGMRRTDRWYYWNAAATTPQFNPVIWTQGVSYCIDSRFMVRNTANMPTSATATIKAQFFPYTSTLNAPTSQMTRIAFFPGTLDATSSTASTYDQFDRINKWDTSRLDLNGGPAYGRNILLADSIFQLEDDLSYLRPGLDDVSKMNLPGISNDRTIPAFQIFPPLTVGKTTAIGSRPILGHLSWMATLVPQIDLAAGQGGDRYLLSIVVFNDRPTDLYLTTGTTGNENLLERTVTALAQDDGSTGGEFLLSCSGTSPTDDARANDRLKVRANDWIMLAGIKTSGSFTVNRFLWYRVTHCDAEVTYTPPATTGAGTYSRYVTLIGQDWDTSVVAPAGASAGQAEATIIQGVSTVFEKTIRLEYGSTF